MNKLDQAREIAIKYFNGLKDKAGKDYFKSHLEKVVGILKKQGCNEDCLIVGYLHDIVEDTNYSFEELSNTFGKEIADVVKIMTHSNSEDYFKYIERVKSNKIARIVKLADLENNMDLSRLKKPSFKDYVRQEKYKKALGILK